MYHHVKRLMYTVRVDAPDVAFGKMLLEQFGGANGELAAAMQYSIQGLNCDDPARKDMLMDIGTEELSHLEIVGTLARLHLQPCQAFREAAEVDPLIAIAGGGGVNLFNSAGNPWTADYLKVTGELDVDLRSNIAAEARAKIVYERLINFCDDVGTRDALQFLMTREITHMKSFATALESMQKPAFSIGQIPPTPELVNKYFNDSTGVGDEGDADTRGPWNEGDEWEYVDAPAFAKFREHSTTAPHANGNGKSGNGKTEDRANLLTGSLVDCLRDLLDAESQLTKALPKMAKAARTGELREAFQTHLEETKTQQSRLEEALELLGHDGQSKPCNGMAGLIAEGEEIIDDGADKDILAADLALIGAAQKVEHYEMAGYLSARNLASQSGNIQVARLLSQSLLEEQRADKILNRIATLLMEATSSMMFDSPPESEDSIIDAGANGRKAATKKQTRRSPKKPS